MKRLAGLMAALASAHAAEVKPVKPVKLELKAEQAVSFPAAVVDGKVVLGPGRLGRFEEMKPADGEVAVGLSPKDKTLYENVVVIEKSVAPIDFVATGLVGNIKIDEIVVHGRLDAPVSQRIGATSWTVFLNGFEPGGK